MSLSDAVKGFEDVAVLDAEIELQRPRPCGEVLDERLLVHGGRDVHLVDHDVVAGRFAAFEERLQVGDVDPVAGDHLRDVGHQAAPVGTARGDDERLAGGRRAGLAAGFAGLGVHLEAERLEPRLDRVVQVARGQPGRQAYQEDARELGLQHGLAHVLDVAAVLAQHARHGRDDAGAVAPEDGQDGLVHARSFAKKGAHLIKP